MWGKSERMGIISSLGSSLDNFCQEKRNKNITMRKTGKTEKKRKIGEEEKGEGGQGKKEERG